MSLPAPSEVRLPQGLRFTDVRRSASETSRWRAVARVLRSPMDALSCALFPASCALCGSPLPHLSSVPICDVCWTEFPVQSGPLCARCGDTLDAPILAGPSSSAACAEPADWRRRPLSGPWLIGPYQDRMKAAIHALKYDRLHAAAHGLGRMLAEAIAQLDGRGAQRDAGGSGAAASIKICRPRLQPGSLAGRSMRWRHCARAIPSGG
jgi:hypothetical protein